jgi:hypothetical protein
MASTNLEKKVRNPIMTGISMANLKKPSALRSVIAGATAGAVEIGGISVLSEV